jgi:tRNA1(Val) A37 N6-methylase TrmN6
MIINLLGGHLKLTDTEPHPTEAPFWLAASIPPIASSTRVLDAGCGPGTAGLALLTRQPSLNLTSLDIDPALTELARQNAALNNLSLTPVTADILTWQAEPFPLILCNPPFHAAARGHITPSPSKTRAHTMPPGGLTQWLAALHRLTTPQGHIHLILHAADQPELQAFTQTNACALTITPIQSSPTRAPKRILAVIQTASQPTCTTTQPVSTRHHLKAPVALPIPTL